MASKTPQEAERETQSLIGLVLGDRYRIDSLIDEGAMGRVFLAEHVMMKKRVALKLLRHELTTVPDVVARFEREAMAAANIDHQNIALATDFGRLADGSVFLVLEYVEGKTLRSQIKSGPMPVLRALHIARQIAAALVAAHDLDIVHRDLKPENVMLIERGQDPDFVKVLDFGVAKVPIQVGAAVATPDRLITRAGMVFGTPEYMAPEQALGQDVSGRADLYSLGVMLFEMLSGMRPFLSDHEVGILGQQLSHGAPTLSERAPAVSVPAPVEQFVSALLATEPSKRTQTAREAFARLEMLHGELARGSEATHEFNATERPPAPFTTNSPLAAYTKLRDRLLKLPPRVRWSAALGGGFIVLLLLLWPRPDAVPQAVPSAEVTSVVPPPISASAEPATNPAIKASAEELARATKLGEKGLGALSKTYPNDPEVLVSLSAQQAKAGKYREAIKTIDAALTHSSLIKDDVRVQRTLKTAAQLPSVLAPAFDTLLATMGDKGADIIYDLATSPNAPAVTKQKAQTLVASKQFNRAASPALAITGELFAAKSCEQRKGLLLRAKNIGDKRTLDLLREMQKGRACSGSEKPPCHVCLKDDPLIADAIAEIAKRAGQAKAP